jgi:hypothetical protein
VTSTLRVVTWMLTRVASSDSGQAGVSKGNLEVPWSIGSTPQMADAVLSWGSSDLKGREESPSEPAGQGAVLGVRTATSLGCRTSVIRRDTPFSADPR